MIGCGPTAEQKADIAKQEAEDARAKEQAEREEREKEEKVVAEKRRQRRAKAMMDECEDAIKDDLKDPFSMQIISRGYKFYDQIQPAKYFSTSFELMYDQHDSTAGIKYTATNSYGGRVRGDGVCFFRNKKMVSRI